MNELIIKPGKTLCGTVEISGSKNSALPILAAALLTKETCKISNIPNLSDIEKMCSILNGVGCSLSHENHSVTVSARDISSEITDTETVGALRGSFLVAGPLLARCSHVRIALPGGCSIGTRPIDLHLKGFRQLGAVTMQDCGYIDISAKKLIGANIYLDFPSVGATENIIMAASLAEGKTVIANAATEPEIVDLADFINKMGGKVKGAGSDTVTVTGVTSLSGCEHSVIPDRIEAGTFMTAAAITRGIVTVKNIIPSHLKPITLKLLEMGINAKEGRSEIKIDASNPLFPVDIKTLPFPGFPTDMQAQFMSLMSTVAGTSIITETIFENRFMQAAELGKMGASIKIDGRNAVIEGVDNLSGARVKATDLRAGAALVLAGLAAKSDTEISSLEHIERGYENLDQKLISLGADIERT